MTIVAAADLTAARIRRANPSIDEETAREDAAALHDIVACVQRRCAAHPKPYPAFEESDLIQTILRTAVGVWPQNEDAAASESFWVADQLMWVEQLTGADKLYEKYLRVCCRVDGADYDDLFTEPVPTSDDDMRRRFLALMGGSSLVDEAAP